MTLSTDRLIHHVESAFPVVPMPAQAELVVHANGCNRCEDLRNDLEDYRGKPITVDLFRLIHQEWSKLSGPTILWILPYYLKYCLTPEASYSQMETEFLVYSLGPPAEFQAAKQAQLSVLNKEQVNCLIQFIEWCQSQPRWQEFFSEEIGHALSFLRALKAV